MKRHKNIPNLKTYSTIDHTAYVFYRDNSNIATRELVKHYVEYGKIMRSFYDIVEDRLVNNLGGVYLEGLGYFGICKYTIDKIYTPKYVKNVSKLAKRDPYYISYVPISTRVIDRLYTMDLSGTTTVKKRLIKNIKDGFAYMFNPSAFYYKLNKNDKKTITS